MLFVVEIIVIFRFNRKTIAVSIIVYVCKSRIPVNIASVWITPIQKTIRYTYVDHTIIVSVSAVDSVCNRDLLCLVPGRKTHYITDSITRTAGCNIAVMIRRMYILYCKNSTFVCGNSVTPPISQIVGIPIGIGVIPDQINSVERIIVVSPCTLEEEFQRRTGRRCAFAAVSILPYFLHRQVNWRCRSIHDLRKDFSADSMRGRLRLSVRCKRSDGKRISAGSCIIGSGCCLIDGIVKFISLRCKYLADIEFLAFHPDRKIMLDDESVLIRYGHHIRLPCTGCVLPDSKHGILQAGMTGAAGLKEFYVTGTQDQRHVHFE